MWTASVLKFIGWTALGAASDYIKPGSGVTVDVIEAAADIINGGYGEIAGILVSMAIEFGFVSILSVGSILS